MSTGENVKIKPCFKKFSFQILNTLCWQSKACVQGTFHWCLSLGGRGEHLFHSPCWQWKVVRYFCVHWCSEGVRCPWASIYMGWFLLRRDCSEGLCTGTGNRSWKGVVSLLSTHPCARAWCRFGQGDVWMEPLGLCIKSHVCVVALQHQGPWSYIRALCRDDCFLRSPVTRAAQCEAPTARNTKEQTHLPLLL